MAVLFSFLLGLVIWVCIEGPERCLNLLNGSWRDQPEGQARTRAARPLKTLLLLLVASTLLAALMIAG